MLKMIIADDENRVLQLINKLVQWDELGIISVGEANNGLAAFDLIVSQAPDIVITDIRMPGMDGLELVRKTREMGLKTSFILVSGYKQFEYAQNALRFGVDEYLVKPINKQELNDILSKIRDRCLEEKGQLENDLLIKSQLKRNRENLHFQFMRSLIFEPERLNLSDIGELNADYQFNFVSGYFQAFALIVDRNSMTIDEICLNRMAEKIPNIIRHCLENSCSEIVAYINNSRVVFVANFKIPETVHPKLGSVLDEVRKHLGIYDYLAVTIGVGSIETGPQGIVQSVQTAMDALSARLELGTDRIIDGTALRFKSIAWQAILTAERESQLIRLTEGLDSESIKKWLEEVFGEMNAVKDIHPRIYLDVSRQILGVFLKAVKRLGLESESSSGEKFADRIDLAITAAELQDALYGYIRDKLGAYLQIKRVQDAKPIRLAKQFISEHYQKPISLEEVARDIHLNPVYFSVVFKKEAGINFRDYLINYRIEKAKSLLKDTPYNLVEIANLVGYKDAKYFSKLFRKVLGITPTEYRKLYS